MIVPRHLRHLLPLCLCWCFALAAVASAVAPASASDNVIRSAQSGAWSNPQTWTDGQVPAAGDKVHIRAEDRVLYDVVSDEPIHTVHVAGTLAFATDRDTRLDVGLLLVRAGTELDVGDFTRLMGNGHHDHEPAEAATMPTLEIGTPQQPIEPDCRAIIRLVHIEGTDPDIYPALVAYQGRIDIHGAPMNRTWVKLAETAKPGDDRVALAEPVTGWNVGDKVIVPTTALLSLFDDGEVLPSVRENSQTEERTIKAIDGTTIVFDEPLEYEHVVHGEFAGEVANLSRNVIIESADPDGVRGHTMYHHGSLGSISYAEFRHLGKKGLLGRYSLHFHRCGDSMRGSSVVGASIWDSHNRWITVHGTDYLVVRDVVGYQSIGHGFFLEDGSEIYNSFDRNLAVQAMNGPVLPDQILPYDHNDGAGFWWANSLNSFTRNVAVECDQYGYRYEARPIDDFEPVVEIRRPDGSSEQVDIRTLPFIRFDDNEARSQRRFGLNLGGIRSVARASDYQNPEGDTDVRTLNQELIRGGDVGGVGPDPSHPFIIRDFKVWASHWAYHSGTPSVFVDGLKVYDSNYGIWRNNSAYAEFRNTSFEDIHRVDIFYPWGGNPSIQDDYDKFLRRRDDRPPVSIITRAHRNHDGALVVTGTTIDNGSIEQVHVNGQPVEALADNFLQWRIVLADDAGDTASVTAVAVDSAGNAELGAHAYELTPRAGSSDALATRDHSASHDASPLHHGH